MSARVMRRAVGLLLLVVAAAAGLRLVSWRPLSVGTASTGSQRRVAGALHVHTTFSDGRSSPEEVIAAAKDAGLDFLIITDHNGFEAKGREGYSDNLLVIVGTEISTHSGHVLAVGLPEPTFRFSDDPSEVLDDIRHFGGAAVLAHPDSPRPDFAWRQWDLPGQWGIEIMNGDTQWRSIPWTDTIRLLSTYPLNPTYALLGLVRRPDATLEQWDRLLRARNTPIVAGADAHGFPSYESVFRVARNHVLVDRLSGDVATDIAAVVSAIQGGASYVGVDGLAPADGFSFVAMQGEKEWTMGDEVPLKPPPLLRAGGALPSGATVSLFRDGDLIEEAPGDLEWRAAMPGAYRVEVRVPDWDVPWILSNPIYVFDAAEHERRRQRLRPPQPIAPATVATLDDFEGDATFTSASDESGLVNPGILAPASGPDGSTAARLSFRLGTPSTATPSPFAALVSSGNRDLSGHRGLVFSIKSDDTYRVWVQVRDKNPRSEDGTEWWYASVRTSTDWQRVALPFERLRTRDPESDGRLDLADTTGIYFIVDMGVAEPGTEGVLWIDDVGVF